MNTALALEGPCVFDSVEAALTPALVAIVAGLTENPAKRTDRLEKWLRRMLEGRGWRVVRVSLATRLGHI